MIEWADVDRDDPRDAAVLSADEQARVSRFRDRRDARRFAARRAFLRQVLGAALDVAPAAVPITAGPHGRPVVDGIEFSASHSDGLAVVAVTQEGLVGVDVERMRDDVHVAELAGRVLSASEVAHIAETGESLFTYWTVKEACLKAAGTGFQRPATSVEVAMVDGEPRVDGWVVNRLAAPRPGFAAALAVSPPVARSAGGR